MTGSTLGWYVEGEKDPRDVPTTAGETGTSSLKVESMVTSVALGTRLDLRP